MIKLTIPGDPIPAARPRFARGRAYQPRRNVEYRKQIQASARQAMANCEPLTGEVSASLKIYRKYKTTSRRFGDVDNHLKGVFDALNKIVFVDDSQITKCVVEKFQDEFNPRREIELTVN